MWPSAGMATETAGRRSALKHKSPPLALWLVGMGIRLAMQHNLLATTVYVKTLVTSVTGKEKTLLPVLKCIQLKTEFNTSETCKVNYISTEHPLKLEYINTCPNARRSLNVHLRKMKTYYL